MHVRGRLGRFASIAFAALALVCLAGCSGGPTTSSFFSSATNLFSGSTKISLAPIVGAPQPIAEQFTQALVVAGKDRHLTILPAGAGGGSYTLRGYLLASSEKGGSKISYIWDVTDAKGNRVARVSGDELVPGRTADPWDNVSGTVLNSIAGKTTSQLAASLPNGSSKPVAAVSSESPAVPATAAPAAPPPRANGVLVAPVSGAPADASGGKQSIRIDWLVLDPSGKRLGTVSQQNTIPRGSLNGPWGAIADAAAGAAADGIIKLLPKSS